MSYIYTFSQHKFKSDLDVLKFSLNKKKITSLIDATKVAIGVATKILYVYNIIFELHKTKIDNRYYI